MWKCKEKALGQLYRTWEDNFQLLFRWKDAVLQKMPDSVIEIDIDEEDGGYISKGSFVLSAHVLRDFVMHVDHT
jgi:hypothetical protein